jgi:hypothetical protein
MRYTTVVDPGVDYDPRQFADEIAVYLADPDGWLSRGVTFTGSSGLHGGCRDPSRSCFEDEVHWMR